jgi:hypothetical protein
MASSPPGPLHTSLSNSKKRPSVGPPLTSASAVKRPKLHPLRQTSFPDPNAIPFSATPSAHSETGSLVSGISSRAGNAPGSGEKRRRGRPKKAGKDRDFSHATQDSAQSGRGAGGGGGDDAGTLVSARSGPGGQGNRSVVSGRSGDEDDEGDGAWAAAAVAENLDAAAKARKEEEDREENRRLMYVFFLPPSPAALCGYRSHGGLVLIVAVTGD